MRSLMFSLFLLLCCQLCLSSAAIAQGTDTGGLTGVVTDQSGAVVPNATVTVRNLATDETRTLTTNVEGRWTTNVLKLGDYEVTATSGSFQPVKQTVAVQATQVTPVDLILGIAVQGVEVEVRQPDDQEQINTEAPTTSSTFSGIRIEQAPVVNRTPFGILNRDSSVSGDPPSPLGNDGGNPEISVNGSRTTSQSVLFNGIDATNISGTGSLTENVSPSPETVQEVKLLSSLYDASVGRSGGGNIQLITRSGGKRFSGTAYIFAQNERFNANDFFFNREGIDRQIGRRLEGGFTLGGPIIKEKLFFFGGYQKTDAITGYVPTAQSFVILPEALLYITDRSNPLNVAQGFAFAGGLGGQALGLFSNPSCIRDLPPVPNTSVLTACIDPNSIGFRLFSLRNPVTGDFFIPTVRANAERLFASGNNSVAIGQNNVFLNIPIPLIDRTVINGIQGGNTLVRQRNVFPAEFKQDQFTTRLDYNLFKGNSEGIGANSLEGTFFFANYPANDPFPDDTLVSPTPLVRDDKNRTLAITDRHIFSANLINEARFGYFFLDNTRQLDERLLQTGFTASDFGYINPATAFVQGGPTTRFPRFVGTRNLTDFSIGAPNDIYNQRNQVTLTFADNVTYTKNNQTFRFGFEGKRNAFDTNLPEEQGGELEGILNFTQLLTSFVPESDTALGITDKQFRSSDLSFYFQNDWRVNNRLTLNLGLRWDWFGWPIEKNGRFTNFDPSLLTSTEDIRPGFILPSNSRETGFNAIDASLGTITRGDNKHTLNGQDLNNFAPRVGFAFKPFNNDLTVIRGGYGIFYDRPSAAFINTIYSNYPFLREFEESFDNSPQAVSVERSLSDINPNLPFSSYFPFRAILNNRGAGPPYLLVDSFDNEVEPLEFRAIDRDLKTPLIQQWNLGIQQQIGQNWLVEARYVGTKGQNLLLAVGFNQPYDLNDPNTPDYIFGRLNVASGTTLGSGSTERERGRGRAFGGCNYNPNTLGAIRGSGPNQPIFRTLPFFDRISNPNCQPQTPFDIAGIFDFNLGGTEIIPAEFRVPFLGLDPTDAIILQSRGYSSYHSGQFSVTRRLVNGIGFTASYTFSKSIDIGSTDPGSTTASGRPDTPNLGLVVQGDQRNINSNRALSDFDRPHRFSTSFVWEIPDFGSKSKFLTGWQLSGFGQWQSGTPFSIIATDSDFLPAVGDLPYKLQFFGINNDRSPRNFSNTPNPGSNPNLTVVTFNVGIGSGSIYRTAFGRPNVTSLELLRRRNCSDITRCYFNVLQNPYNADGTLNSDTALLSPFGGFGNLGRNILRGPSQKRIDLSLQKRTNLTERVVLELKWDVFNVFNFVNFASPNADLSDETDFGQITRTLGAPRVMQFGAKLRF